MSCRTIYTQCGVTIALCGRCTPPLHPSEEIATANAYKGCCRRVIHRNIAFKPVQAIQLERLWFRNANVRERQQRAARGFLPVGPRRLPWGGTRPEAELRSEELAVS